MSPSLAALRIGFIGAGRVAQGLTAPYTPAALNLSLIHNSHPTSTS